MLLADYRMPQMNGIEFLEQAMDLFPRARRVLLTAYADTDAAIARDQRRRRRPLPAQALGPAGGEALPGRRRTCSRPGSDESRRAGARDQGGRAPVVGAVVPRSATSWPATRCPTAGTASTSRRGSGCSRPPAPDADDVPVVITARRRRARSPTDAELAAAVGLSDDPGRGLLRPGRRRRRPGRARRRGVRRVRGAAHRAGRADRDRRPGRAELAGSRTTSASPTASPAAS